MEAFYGFLLVTMMDTDYGTHNWNIFWQSKASLHERERALLDSVKMQMIDRCRIDSTLQKPLSSTEISFHNLKQVFNKQEKPF